MFRHILVPVGLGAGSLAAARHALNLSRWLGCKVTLVHVLEDGEASVCEPFAQMVRGARRQPTVLLVEPHSQTIGAVVAQTVLQIHADLIVIGCHDSPQQAPAVLGPAAQSIVADAKVPVQVVPTAALVQGKPWLQRLTARTHGL
ncbi:MAG: universal stress protein [Meiothermus sp.]|uniref:universal stress protein n=1 Tax=Meiothermus sp. TaxID=1955249 RepID=UPI0025DBD650|nr:universal stress protein [Meiothermus sp.]MCS7068719.1 universal stress protein [Meiothermus sp.]